MMWLVNLGPHNTEEYLAQQKRPKNDTHWMVCLFYDLLVQACKVIQLR